MSSKLLSALLLIWLFIQAPAYAYQYLYQLGGRRMGLDSGCKWSIDVSSWVYIEGYATFISFFQQKYIHSD